VARFDAEQEEATRERAAQRRESASAGRRGDAAGDAVAAEVSAGGAKRPAARRAAQPTGRLPRWYPGSPWLALPPPPRKSKQTATAPAAAKRLAMGATRVWEPSMPWQQMTRGAGAEGA